MTINKKKVFFNCLKVSHTVTFLLTCLCALFCSNTFSEEKITFLDLREAMPNEYAPLISTHHISRFPASFIPSDEVALAPAKQRIWYKSFLEDDETGIVNEVKNQFKSWEQQEDFINQWDLASTNLYHTPNLQSKKDYLNRKLLKLVDKTLSSKVKHSDNPTLAGLRKTQEMIKPQSTFQVSKNIKFKLKAKLIQGEAYVNIENPYVHYSTYFNLDGTISMNMNRNIDSLGVHAAINYAVSSGSWVASLSKKLTDRITSKISSHQSDKELAFTNSSNRIVEVSYGYRF